MSYEKYMVDKIALLMEERNMTLEQLAAKIKSTKRTLSKYLNEEGIGGIGIVMLFKIARALNVHMAELFG